MFCPKYRGPVLDPPVDARTCETTIRRVCDERYQALIELEVVPDHVHLLVGSDPRSDIHRLVKGVKGRSSRVRARGDCRFSRPQVSQVGNPALVEREAVTLPLDCGAKTAVETKRAH